MNLFQHPDSVWTWRSSAGKAKAALWIPYLQKVERTKKGWNVSYNGGEFIADLKQTDCVMMYGASGDLPLAFLDDLATKRIPLLIHRRNLPDPYVFIPGMRRDDADILSAQIIARANQTKTTYVARTLVRERFRSIAFPVASTFFTALAQQRSVENVRNLEAHQSRNYWQRYFESLGMPDVNRRSEAPVTAALDAGSFFLYGIFLRWLLVHRLSPAHGFLHVTSGYPSLAYDLMEPYRYIIENAVADAVRADAQDLTAQTLDRIKESLEHEVFVPTHRVTVRRKNLLHGAILGLRAWLLGETPRLVIPAEGQRIGGRKPNVGFVLPGSQRLITKKKVAPV
jgi:CRISPR/Cas system-associated endonuclease Cas1